MGGQVKGAVRNQGLYVAQRRILGTLRESQEFILGAPVYFGKPRGEVDAKNRLNGQVLHGNDFVGVHGVQCSGLRDLPRGNSHVQSGLK
jgi:hypothetical protein